MALCGVAKGQKSILGVKVLRLDLAHAMVTTTWSDVVLHKILSTSLDSYVPFSALYERPHVLSE